MSYAYVAGMLLFMVRGQLLLNGSSALGRGVEPADRIAFLAHAFRQSLGAGGSGRRLWRRDVLYADP